MVTSGATTKWAVGNRATSGAEIKGAAGNRATSGVEIKGADTPAVRTGEATVGKKRNAPSSKGPKRVKEELTKTYKNNFTLLHDIA